MIHVIAILTAKPGRRADVLREFHANIPAVLAEEGCIEYGPAVDIDALGAGQVTIGEDAFMVVEKWASVEALRAHARAPHMAAYGARVKDLLASRAVHVLAPHQAG